MTFCSFTLLDTFLCKTVRKFTLSDKNTKQLYCIQRSKLFDLLLMCQVTLFNC